MIDHPIRPPPPPKPAAHTRFTGPKDYKSWSCPFRSSPRPLWTFGGTQDIASTASTIPTRPRQETPQHSRVQTGIFKDISGILPFSPVFEHFFLGAHASYPNIPQSSVFEREKAILNLPPVLQPKLSSSYRLPTDKQLTSEIMGIFVRLIDYAEDKKLHDYSFLSATLALLFLGLFLLLKKEWSVHSSTKFPVVGLESPGYLGLVKARDRFVSNAFRIVKSGYHKVSLHTVCSIISHRLY